jgi:hypothetical protein
MYGYRLFGLLLVLSLTACTMLDQIARELAPPDPDRAHRNELIYLGNERTLDRQVFDLGGNEHHGRSMLPYPAPV